MMRMEGECGDCLRGKAEADLARTTAQGLDGQTDVDLGQESFKLSKMFPTVKRYQGLSRSVGDVDGRAKREGGSLLRRVVLAEEVVEKYEVHKTLTGARWDQEEWVSRSNFILLCLRGRLVFGADEVWLCRVMITRPSIKSLRNAVRERWLCRWISR